MGSTKIKSLLCHLGYNMWGDYKINDGVPRMENIRDYPYDSASPVLRFDYDFWREIVDDFAAIGGNMIVLDLGEGLKYDSHPELAVEGSWDKKHLADEIDYCKSKGIEIIPKLNFSTCHDEWLGKYCRMVSTQEYYKVCADLIDEVSELFGNPRFFHIGMDEEGIDCQREFNLVVIRQGPLWWHDFNYLCDCVRKNGSRPWMWADAIWQRHDDFLKNMSKDVLMSNWYYGKFPDNPREKIMYGSYDELDKYGFDQVPGGSNWSCNDNFANTVEYCKSHVSDEHLLGFMQTIWYPTLRECETRYKEGIAQMSVLKD